MAARAGVDSPPISWMPRLVSEASAATTARPSSAMPFIWPRSTFHASSASRPVVPPSLFTTQAPANTSAVLASTYVPVTDAGLAASVASIRLESATESAIFFIAFSYRGASPLELPYTRSRSPLRRLAPIAWLTRGARSRLRGRSISGLRSRSRIQSRGFAPRTPLHALSLAASPARSDRVAHSRRSFAPHSAQQSRPSQQESGRTGCRSGPSAVCVSTHQYADTSYRSYNVASSESTVELMYIDFVRSLWQ